MYQPQKSFIFKLFLGITFFIGLSWLNLFLTPKTVSATRKEANEVYVQPIEGLEESGLFGPSQADIIEAIIMDNYQVYCAAPAQTMDAEIGEEYIRYLELEPGNMKTHEIATTMTDSEDILNPLILDDSGEEKTAVFKENKQSYVQYLNNSKTNDSSIKQNLVTADYYKLYSLEEQLAAKERAKKNTIFLCSKLDIPLSDCPLNVTVPGISMEIGEIDIPDYGELVDPNTREELINSPHLKGTAYLPLSRVYGKRPAYLVTCVEQQKSSASDIWNSTGLEDLALYMSTGWRSILSSFFGDLTKNLFLKKDECHVRTILVDSAATEDESWNSVEAHNISRGFFTPYKDQKAQEEAYKKARGARNEIAQGERADGFDADDRVNLVGTSNDQTQALVHMINGLAPVCGNENIRTETSPTITSEANFSEGGATYKTSGKTADEDWGLLDSLFAQLNAEIETGERTKNDIDSRYSTLETFLIAPYDAQITMDQFFSPLEEYKITREQAETIWPTHVLFNKGVGEGQEYRLSAGTTKSSQKFDDPEDCRWIEGHPSNKNGEWIEGHWDCTKEYGVGITGADQELGVDVIADKTRGNIRPMLSLLPYDSSAYNHVEKYGSSSEANNEKLIKGRGDYDCLDENGLSVPCGEVNKIRCQCDGGYWKIGPDTSTCDEVCNGNDGIDVIAQCNGGARVGSGEGAQHICQDTGAYCPADELKSTNNPDGSCSLLEAQHYIPDWKNASDKGKPCSEELYSYIACNDDWSTSLIANPVNAQGQFTESGTMTACEYVVKKAEAAGVSPHFALAMWGEESGWSSIKHNAFDFGVTSVDKFDLGAQVSGFLNTVNNSSNYLSFMMQYSGEEEGNVFCRNAGFPARVREFYNYFSTGWSP